MELRYRNVRRGNVQGGMSGPIWTVGLDQAETLPLTGSGFVYSRATLASTDVGHRRARPYWSNQTRRRDVSAGSDDLTAFVLRRRRDELTETCPLSRVATDCTSTVCQPARPASMWSYGMGYTHFPPRFHINVSGIATCDIARTLRLPDAPGHFHIAMHLLHSSEPKIGDISGPCLFLFIFRIKW